ncbi:MAG TPA: hypothetical protein VF263_26470 [Longimicrobiaceae bacterium]
MSAASRLEELLARLFPEREPALRVEEVVELALELLRGLGVSAEVWEGRLSVRTVRYYRTQGIVSAPSGDGPNSRYGRRHVLETAAARLAGHLHHLSLAAAAERISALDDDGLVALLAELAEKEAGDHVPRPLPGAPAARREPGAEAEAGVRVEAAEGVILRLPHGAVLVLPRDHPALSGGRTAESVGRSVAEALGAGGS